MVGLGLLLPRPAAAIPVFARIYGKPCGACHVAFPELNPAGETLRMHGLHGLTPAIEPIQLGPYFSIPGTLPLAVSAGVGEDIVETNPQGSSESTRTHFNLEYLSLLAGGELGPYLSFFADYTRVVSNPQTGDFIRSTRPGLAFLQAHAEQDNWLGNMRLGLFELPVG